ncbi:MAG TPA: hypothetical protein VF657_19135, partial [Actinoplanes sp.]
LAHDTVAGTADGAEPVSAPVIDRGRFTADILSRLAAQQLSATSLGRALQDGSAVWRVWLDTPVRTAQAGVSR